MIIMLSGLLAAGFSELLLYWQPVWRQRRWLGPLLLIVTAGCSGALSTVHTNLWSFIALVFALYRCFNLTRLTSGVSGERYRYFSARRSSMVLLGCQLSAVALWSAAWQLHVASAIGWIALAIIQLLLALGLAATTEHAWRAMRQPRLAQGLSNHDLPSITVCIPARNETEILADCLRRLTTSDYPKLEILVLDDCSQDRTSDIIRSFAHDGVRFLKGSVPPEGWLAKNWAYQQLYEAANGQLLVFCGVDIVFDTPGLRQLVNTYLAAHYKMLGVMPINAFPPRAGWKALLVQPLRYAWELCLPRKRLRRPPVLSSCWVADRRLIHAGGSFKAVNRSVSPESHFARLALRHQAYGFLCAGDDLAIGSRKPFGDQLETAIRTRYPQLHRRPELVALLCLVEAAGVAASLPLGLIAASHGQWLAAAAALTAFVVLSATFAGIVQITYRRFRWQAMLALIPALLADIVIRNLSMWRYEFSSVEWKGRNVCLPVMRVEPRLPPLPDRHDVASGSRDTMEQ